MRFDLFRDIESPRSVLGQLSINGVFVCYTLEPARTTPVHPGHPCIPAGEYNVRLSQSPHLGYETPEVLDVPGRTAIRIHIGNKPEDVLGCAVVGDHRSEDFVSNSRVTFWNKIMPACRVAEAKGEPITIVYHDPGK